MVFAFTLFSLLFLTAPQEQSQAGVSNTLFGDFRVGQQPESSAAPSTFQLILLNRSQQVVGRDILGPVGRYRFSDLPNGDYVLIVQVEEVEVTRMPIRLDELQSGRVRRDIALEWKEVGRAARDSKASPPFVYARSKDHRKSFEHAMRELGRENAQAAAGELHELVEKHPDDFEAWTELGTAYFLLKSFDEALQAYQKALALQPDFLAALINLGKLEFSMHRFEQAAEHFRSVLDQDPDRPHVHYLLAESYLQLKKGSLAEPHFERALELAPAEMADAHLRLAKLYDRAGLKSRAAQQYEMFLKKRPDFAEREELERYIKAHSP